MITLAEEGEYNLIETPHGIKILKLQDKLPFAWVHVGKNIGEILVESHKSHRADHFLTSGRYRLYDVKKEPRLTDVKHLELLVGRGMWQGYLLPTGFPTKEKKRSKIVPTKEVITRSII